MQPEHLHIVTHEVPWPVEHGGFTDLFYKLEALHARGTRIYLHCYTTDGIQQPELEKYCSRVHYYPREKNFRHLSFKLPFIVNSRKSKELIAELEKDDHPVLLEGIHTTYWLSKGRLKNRKVAVRLHNAEFEYYHQLAKKEAGPLKKLFFFFESRLLKKYERRLANKALFLTVSTQDLERYRREFNAADIRFLPVFLPYTLAVGREGRGCFCLYHGNLTVNENEYAVNWLLENVFKGSGIPFVIAGKGPSADFEHRVHQYPDTCLVANPSDAGMQDLIAKAQLHVVPSFNNTGVKLKLLNAFFNGRHCLANPAAIAGSGLEAYCTLATDAASFREKIKEMYELPFTEEEKQIRQGLLQTVYNNAENAKKLMTFLS